MDTNEPLSGQIAIDGFPAEEPAAAAPGADAPAGENGKDLELQITYLEGEIERLYSELDRIGARKFEIADPDEIDEADEYFTACLKDIVAAAWTLAETRIAEAATTAAEAALETATPAVKPPPGLPAELLEQAFFPALTGDIVSDYMEITRSRLKGCADDLSNAAIYITKDGNRIRVKDFKKVGAMGVFSKKLINHTLVHLAQDNYHEGDNIDPIVQFPLKEFAELTGRDITPHKMDTPEAQKRENARAKEHKRQITNMVKRSFEDMKQSFDWTATVEEGPAKGDYTNVALISSHEVKRGMVTVVLDMRTAKLLVEPYYLLQLPKALYTFDERNENAYAIAYKIAQYSSMYSNIVRGLGDTLSVKSLLEAAPEIPSYEKLKETGNRNWKLRIKTPFEKALDACAEQGYLDRWEYRNPKTGKTYTPAEANTLTYNQWHKLMVDYVIANRPDLTEQIEAWTKKTAERTKKLEEHNIAVEAKVKERAAKKKAEAGKSGRGQPRKAPAAAKEKATV